MQGGIKENRIRLATRFHNRENGAYALLSTVSTLQSDSLTGRPQLKIRFAPSTFTSNGQMWGLGAREILCDSSRIVIDGFRMVSGQQRLEIDGVASRSLSDTLKLQLHNFDLTPFSPDYGPSRIPHQRLYQWLCCNGGRYGAWSPLCKCGF